MVITRSSNKIITRSNKSQSTIYTGITSERNIRKQNAKHKKKKLLVEETTIDYDVTDIEEATMDCDDTEIEEASIESDITEIEEASIESDITEIEDLKSYSIHLFKEEFMYWNDEPVIDFDDAHDCWMANKRKGSNGTYYYICGKIQKNGKKCERAQVDMLGLYSGCKRHFKWEESE
jgi:hypothetical protein